MKKAFQLIVDRISAALLEQQFSLVEATEENTALFVNETTAYSLFYDKEKKQFALRTCPVTEDGPDGSWKTISAWLFDPDIDSQRDAEGIAADFAETIQGPKRKAIVQGAKKKKKDAENTVDPLFLMNRLVNIFPELREEIRVEKECYSTFRGVTFTEKNVLPRMQSLLRQRTNSAKLKKFCALLSDMYHVGDLDVRGIITALLLNSIEEEEMCRRVEEEISDELKKAWKTARKLKNKKIRPEKPKKKKSFMADTLSK